MYTPSPHVQAAAAVAVPADTDRLAEAAPHRALDPVARAALYDAARQRAAILRRQAMDDAWQALVSVLMRSLARWRRGPSAGASAAPSPMLVGDARRQP